MAEKKKRKRGRRKRKKNILKIYFNPLRHACSPKIVCTILECRENPPKIQTVLISIEKAFGEKLEKKTQGPKFQEVEILNPCILLDLRKLV